MDTMERLLEQAASRASHTPRDSDVDGRPAVGWRDDDPLLERLIRFHPDLIPAKLMKELATNRARVPLLASGSD